MSVHVDDVFMAGNRDTFEKRKEKIQPDFNIQDYRKVKKFLRLYQNGVMMQKVRTQKLTTEKDVQKLVEGYDKNMGGEVKVQEPPGAPGTTPKNSDLEEPQDINNYR